MTTLFGIALFVFVASFFIQRYAYRGEIESYKAFKIKYESGKDVTLSRHESWEEWLIKAKYFNRHGYDLFIPDEVDDLK